MSLQISKVTVIHKSQMKIITTENGKIEQILKELFEKLDYIIKALNIALIFNCDIERNYVSNQVGTFINEMHLFNIVFSILYVLSYFAFRITL